MEWAVGKQGELMRPNSGKLMLPGSRINWDIHYSNGSEDVTDVVELGIYFYPKGQEPKYRQTLEPLERRRHRHRAERNESHAGFPYDGTRRPHRELAAAYAPARQGHDARSHPARNGQKQIFSYVNDFNFNWHNSYVYADDVAPLLPKGTIIIVTAWHDNTTAKKSNPDPTQWVGYGDRTVDEMAHAWVNVTYMSDEDYTAEVEARKAATSNAQQQAQAR